MDYYITLYHPNTGGNIETIRHSNVKEMMDEAKRIVRINGETDLSISDDDDSLFSQNLDKELQAYIEKLHPKQD